MPMNPDATQDGMVAGFGTPEAASLGGVARAVSLTPERRQEIGRKAANARWGNDAALEMNQDVFSVSSGHIVVRWPTPLTADDCRDILEWLDIWKRKFERKITEEENDRARQAKILKSLAR